MEEDIQSDIGDLDDTFVAIEHDIVNKNLAHELAQELDPKVRSELARYEQSIGDLPSSTDEIPDVAEALAAFETSLNLSTKASRITSAEEALLEWERKMAHLDNEIIASDDEVSDWTTPAGGQRSKSPELVMTEDENGFISLEVDSPDRDLKNTLAVTNAVARAHVADDEDSDNDVNTIESGPSRTGSFFKGTNTAEGRRVTFKGLDDDDESESGDDRSNSLGHREMKQREEDQMNDESDFGVEFSVDEKKQLQVLVFIPFTASFKVDGNPVAFYRVESSLMLQGEKIKSNARYVRFRQFYQFNSTLRGLYSRNHKHLLNNLPALPSRKLKLFQDHHNVTFIEQRREKLQAYVQTLAQLPYSISNWEFINFLGLA